ncbi:MAG: hypothetical protein ABSC94_18040 [Polyangiaceae bacterium]|jgi:hypothetical protein
MRISVVALPLGLALVSCGGAHKPAESPGDTASLDSSGSSAAAKDTAAPTESSTATTPETPASAAGSKAEAAAPSAGASTHPAPSATGTIDGKPFAPKLARVTGKAQKDGRILLTLDDAHSDCSTSPGEPGDATLTILVPWEDGYKVDLAALKRSTKKKGSGEIGFSRTGPGGKKVVSATFKPSGMVTIIKAPGEANATGKMKIDLQSGDYMLAGDLDILMCTAAK